MTQPTAEQLEVTADSDMDADSIAIAEWVWTNLPARPKWSSLATHEKALVCHTLARHRQATEARMAAVEAERERCAALADNHSFALDIDEWMMMTKKEISAYACRSVAAAIRSQSNDPANP